MQDDGPAGVMSFGDRLTAAVAARESQIVLGIDPQPDRLWPEAVARASEARAALAHALAEAERAAALEIARPPAAQHREPGHRTDVSEVGAVARDPELGHGAGMPDAGAPGGAEAVPAVPDPSGAGSAHPAGSAGGPLGVGSATTAATAAPAAGRLEAAAAVLAHSLALVDAAGPACVAVKPQLAFFEQLGFAGWLVLEAVCAHARARELLVLADGKRGDVPSTALAYSRALTGATPTPFGAASGLGADAFTANPLLGRDALQPLVDGARQAGAGAFLLVRTSNPGAADLLDLELASGEPLWERLAHLVAELGEPGSSGLADVGAVTGATAPEHLERMRALMPRGAVPAARRGRPGRRRRRARARLRARPGGRSGDRLAVDRQRPRAELAPARGGRPGRGRAPPRGRMGAGLTPSGPPGATAIIARNGPPKPRALSGAARRRGRRRRVLRRPEAQPLRQRLGQVASRGRAQRDADQAGRGPQVLAEAQAQDLRRQVRATRRRRSRRRRACRSPRSSA